MQCYFTLRSNDQVEYLHNRRLSSCGASLKMFAGEACPEFEYGYLGASQQW
jgi:hypothetical protein